MVHLRNLCEVISKYITLHPIITVEKGFQETIETGYY